MGNTKYYVDLLRVKKMSVAMIDATAKVVAKFQDAGASMGDIENAITITFCNLLVCSMGRKSITKTKIDDFAAIIGEMVREVIAQIMHENLEEKEKAN